MRLVFVDTSGFAAAMNARDRHHEEAKAVFRKLGAERSVLVTTNYVRAEAHALLLARAGRELALRFLEDRSWAVEWVDREDEKKAMEILHRFRDKDFSLTDATSFAVMERLGIREAVSFDRHFSQYGVRTVSAE